MLNANSLRLEYACRANRSAENCERKREMGEEEKNSERGVVAQENRQPVHSISNGKISYNLG